MRIRYIEKNGVWKFRHWLFSYSKIWEVKYIRVFGCTIYY